jgi:uncharacterized protein (DUF58 family)
MASLARLPNPAAFFRRRFQAWFENRLPLTDQVTLTQRTVYILPTRPGVMLGVTLLVLLVASINYQLNLGYLLTFLLAGCALVGMHVCHATLRGIAMNLVANPATFARTAAFFDIKLTSTRRTARYGIGVRVLHNDAASPSSTKTVEADKQPHWVWTDIPALGSSTVRVAFSPRHRGLHRVPTLTAETRFPLGTFRVWTVWRPAAQIMVYPEPEAHPPSLPPGEPRSGGAAAAARSPSTGEFDGVRAYRRGDPMKLVVWKKAAKADDAGNGLVVRDTQQSEQHELWLDFMLAGSGDAEHKLSRLCAWVLMADKLGVAYGLRLPALALPPATGEAHRRACLEALALC